MMYMTERRILAARGDGNAYVKSNDAVYRLIYGRPAPVEARRVKTEGVREPVSPYGPVEARLIDTMPRRMKALYLEIRKAAEAGDPAPRQWRLQEVSWSCDKDVRRAMGRLERMGAIERLPSPPSRGAIYRLPVAGLETRP